MTVSDNDFTNKLERFAAIIAEGYLMGFYSEAEYDANKHLHNEVRREEKDLMEAFHKESSEITSEQNQFTREIVTKYFKKWTEKHFDKDTAKYLAENFKVEIISAIPDKWENNEVVFVIPTAYNGKIVTT